MIDLSGFKKLVIGGTELKKLAINGIEVWRRWINWVPLSVASDGRPYNGGLGYKNGYRVRSGGAEASTDDCACTGFIPVKGGDEVRFSGMPWFEGTTSGNALNAADSEFVNLGQFTMGQNVRYGIFESLYSAYAAQSVVEEKAGVWKWIVPPSASGVAYIRITAYDKGGETSGADMIVTINEEIT